MKIAYFDCFSGISGDMCLGALVDAGVPAGTLKRELKKLPLKGYTLSAEKLKRGGLGATKINIGVDHRQEHIRRWKDIKRIISDSALEDSIKQKGLKIFKDLFVSEAIVHGMPYDRVYLHELGSIDAIADIMGTLICLERLGIKKVFSSPVNTGGGLVKATHGVLPVPAPATAELLKGIPVYSTGASHELTTPTGAAIVKGISSGFGGIPPMKLDVVGMGAGERDFKDKPNILRVLIGEARIGEAHHQGDDAVTVMEANIDDMNPQIYEHVMEKLFKGGALDVYLTQVIMKKGRPGVLLTILCPEEKTGTLSRMLLKETTTLGLRHYRAERTVLKRKILKKKTEFGTVRFKAAYMGDDMIRLTPEYKDCKRVAGKTGMPLIEVMEKVRGK